MEKSKDIIESLTRLTDFQTEICLVEKGFWSSIREITVLDTISMLLNGYAEKIAAVVARYGRLDYIMNPEDKPRMTESLVNLCTTYGSRAFTFSIDGSKYNQRIPPAFLNAGFIPILNEIYGRETNVSMLFEAITQMYGKKKLIIPAGWYNEILIALNHHHGVDLKDQDHCILMHDYWYSRAPNLMKVVAACATPSVGGSLLFPQSIPLVGGF